MKRNPGASNILFACVTDNEEEYLEKALRLIKSIRWFGGRASQADILICAVNGINSYYENLYRSYGATVRTAPEFHPKNPYANKLRIFDQPDIKDYETLILLDCDTLVLQDPLPYVDGNFRASIAPVPTISSNTLTKLCDRLNLKAPAPIYTNTYARTKTIWYCNSGVLVLPVALIKYIVPHWITYQNLLLDDPILFRACGMHTNQASLALAYAFNPIPFNQLPFAMNFQLNHLHMPPPMEVIEADPVIVHYHQKHDAQGCIPPLPYTKAHQRVRAFNNQLRKEQADQKPAPPAVISPCENPAPFIVGSGRSGTNLLRLMLDSHPQIAIAPESHFLPDAMALSAEASTDRAKSLAFFKAIRNHQRWEDFGLDEQLLKNRITSLEPFDPTTALRAFYQAYADRFQKPRWGDHTPAYAFQVDLIKRILPEAHFIHLLRDGRDVALSYQGFWFAPGREKETALYWRRRTKAAQAALIRHRHYFQARYQDLITDPEKTLRKICGFLRLDWDPIMLQYYQRAPERIRDLNHDVYRSGTGELIAKAQERMRIYSNLDRPPDTTRLDRWEREMSAEQLRATETAVGAFLTRQGFRLSGTTIPLRQKIRMILRRLFSAAYFPSIAARLGRGIFS